MELGTEVNELLSLGLAVFPFSVGTGSVSTRSGDWVWRYLWFDLFENTLLRFFMIPLCLTPGGFFLHGYFHSTWTKVRIASRVRFAENTLRKVFSFFANHGVYGRMSLQGGWTLKVIIHEVMVHLSGFWESFLSLELIYGPSKIVGSIIDIFDLNLFRLNNIIFFVNEWGFFRGVVFFIWFIYAVYGRWIVAHWGRIKCGFEVVFW